MLSQPHIGEVLLCVGPSSDNTLQVAQRLVASDERVHLIDNADGGIPQALNHGLAHSQGEILMRVDAHSFVPDGYVENALETLEATGAANVGAVQLPTGHTTVERGIAAAMRSRIGSGGAAYRVGVQRQQVDTAFLGFFRTAALREIDGWDERFARNEDAELNARLAQAGHEIWLDPRLRVDYRPRPSLRALATQYWHYGIWRLCMVRKHPRSLKLRQLAAPLIVIALVLSVALALAGRTRALIVAIAYLLAVVAAAVLGNGSFRERVVMVGALITMHLCWGAAFLWSAFRSLFAPNL